MCLHHLFCAFLSAANIGLNNYSMLYINAAMNQMIKATMPVLTAIVSGEP